MSLSPLIGNLSVLQCFSKAVSAPGGSTLLDGLVSYWKLDGSGTDSLGTNNLTPTNITWTTGKIGQAAELLNSGGSNLSKTSATVPVSNLSAWIWWYTGLGPAYSLIPVLGIYKTAKGSEQLALGILANYDAYYGQLNVILRVGFAGSGGFPALAQVGLPIPQPYNQHHAYYIYVDYTAKQFGYSVNNATLVTSNIPSSYVDPLPDEPSRIVIQYPYRADEAAFWSRTLTAEERTTLYNAGAGNTYPFT